VNNSIFVSFTSADRAWAHWIGGVLKDNGYEPRVHDWEIGAGQNIARWMDKALEESDRLIGVFSNAYVDAIYSSSERWAAYWDDPMGKRGGMIPIEVRPVTKWPPLTRSLKRLSLIALDENSAKKELLKFLEPPSFPSELPPFPVTEPQPLKPQYPRPRRPTASEFKERIEKTSATWEAGPNSPGDTAELAARTSRMSISEIGREPSGGRGSIFTQEFAFTSDSIPSKVDWRDATGASWISPVKDQGHCGAAVAFAVCGALESRIRIKRQDASYDIDLSEAHLFFCGTKNGGEDGWQIGSALERCRDVGVGLESDFPYSAKQPECKEIDPIVRVPRWRRVTDSYSRKKALQRSGPVVGGAVIHSDFPWYRGGVYRPTTTEVIGLNAFEVIGFNDSEGYWIVKNSWGTGWGDNGFAKIGYGSCGLDYQFPFYDIEIEILTKT
jgi:C1A family cysteine protease